MTTDVEVQAVEAQVKEKPSLPLRLEWIEAGSLTDNPGNWRRHGQEQLESLRELLADPDVGWAGACLYNERTGRLIDGHARKGVVDPATPIPVLVGSWSEAGEAKILATLDPVAQMASADAEAYRRVSEMVEADGLFTRDLIDRMLAEAGSDDSPAGANGDGDAGQGPERMELEPFEHYDYVLVLARNTMDWEALCEALGLSKRNVARVPGQKKIGLGRAIDAGRVLALLRNGDGT